MAFDGANVIVNPGAITFGGTDLGLKAEAVVIDASDILAPIYTEDFGEIPLDMIHLGNIYTVTAVLLEWNATVRDAVAGHQPPASGSGFDLGTQDASDSSEIIGRKMTALKMGSLSWTAAGGTGFLTYTAARAVPARGLSRPFEIELSRRRAARYAATWVCLPPAAGGTAITIRTS